MNSAVCTISHVLQNSGSYFLKVLSARFWAQGSIIGNPKIKSRLFSTNFRNSFNQFTEVLKTPTHP
jgi:hypothetical protein